MATTTRVNEYARVGSWGLKIIAVEDSQAEYELIRYPEAGRRHSAPYEVMGRVTFPGFTDEGLDATNDWMMSLGAPEGTAGKLRNQAWMKFVSPKFGSLV